jgi:hypothetical protein
MLNNHIYNLILQLTQEHKSLWRIKNEYRKDARGCKRCRLFWKEIEKDKESQVKKLEQLIKSHWR